MKKLILALVALACAFAISSCCDQSYCPGNLRCGERGWGGRPGGPGYPGSGGPDYSNQGYPQDGRQYQQTQDVPYRFDRRDQPVPGSWRDVPPPGCPDGHPMNCPDTPPRTHRRW